MHHTDIRQRLRKGFGGIGQRPYEIVVLIDKQRLYLIQREGVDDGAQPLIELQTIALQTDAPGLHPGGFHHIAQLRLIELDGLIDLFQFLFVLLCLKVQFSFLGHIGGRNGEIDGFAILVKDRVHADFQINAHISLGNNAERTPPIVIQMMAVQHLIERKDVKEIGVREVGIAILAVEVTDFTHDAVRIQQPAIGRIERQTDDGVLENETIAFGEFFHFLFFEQVLRLVLDGSDDAHNLAADVFTNSIAVQVMPVRSTFTRIVVIPSPTAVRLFIDASLQSVNKRLKGLAVLGMNIGKHYINTHIVAEHRLAVKVVHTILLQVKTHHVVATDVERHLHSSFFVNYITEHAHLSLSVL